MDWKSASSYYETLLGDVLNIQHFAVDLAKLPQAEVPPQLTETLIEEAKPANRQLERLRKREFRIAVVGLEKAGKSTFINAWLECDLLPAKGGRCTFTTTQIYSVKSESEQRLEVQTRTEEQFIHLLKALETAGANEDLKTIQENKITLQQVRQEGNLVIPFTRLEDIREQLKKYVADEKYAHAVLEARLYTNKLAQAEGIVFYDVPGSDSGLAKHVDEAQQMLSDCDAVIVIQRFRSIREAELEIIKFTEQGDKNVTIADKLFVFLSHIDSLGSAEALKTHIAEASQDWSKRANLPVNRIVSGSAGAYLILNNLAEEHTQLEIGQTSNIRDKLRTLTGIIDDDILKTEGTGIPNIKQKIFNYINTERVEILRKRCEASIDKLVNTSEEIYHLVSQKFPENPEEAQRFEEEKRRISFSEWWKSRWEQIKADLQKFYETSVINKPLEKVNNHSSSSIEKFRERYQQLVESEMEKLRQETLRKKETIFDANSFPDFDKARANYAWRDDLYADIRKFLDALARQLAAELKDEALKLVDYMSSLLWGSHQVKDRLIGYSEQEFLTRLENSLSVLFLRFARPVAEALIRGPVNSDTRSQIVKSLGADVELIDNYYQGDEPAFRVLKKYVKYGSDLLFKADLRQQVLGVAEIAKNVIGMTIDTVMDLSDELKSARDIVTFEVTNDINAFEEYLRNGIFEAAGFESYCIQELRGLVDLFREKEGTWAGVAQNEWYKENPQLLAELPRNLKSQEFNLEVSERLRQLSTALKRSNRDMSLS
ncbi:dynamin family protein [Geminocystis sp. CENA526]|uniref:dynamin family protein n=1 Tax=Geminocystis sp. CENA526 TaxID=1355871 RepID=UPI003D6F37EE